MWTLGIHAGKHNSSICLLKDEQIELFIEEERLSKIKYDNEPIKCLEEIKKVTTVVDNLIITHSNHLGYIKHLLRKNGVTIGSNIEIRNDIHHLCHAASAFYGSGFTEAVCVVFDGRGSEFELSNGAYGAETTSVYKVSYPANFELVYKKLVIDPIRGTNFEGVTLNTQGNVEISSNIDIGGMYQAVTNLQGFNNLDCGKTMGLAAYGKENLRLPDLCVGNKKESNSNVFTNDNKINTRLYPQLKTSIDEQIQADLAFALQKATQEKALNYIIQAIKTTKIKNVVLSGGYALNVVANKYYKDKLPGINFYVDPLASDGGLSHGAAKLMYYSLTQSTRVNNFKNLYLGPKTINKKIQENDVETQQVAELLNQGKVVALFQGRSEAGPRALGNRSILFNPTLPDGKKIINTIKNREWFRPFAGTILKNYAEEWFDINENSFMTFTANCKQPTKIPAIIHEDGTCRIQTLTEEQNVMYYKIIKEFYALTNVPIVGNTSFNVDKQPIIETLEDALKALEKTKIDYLYLADTKDLISRNPQTGCTNQ